MLKCKTCGEVFPGIYVPEDSTVVIRSAAAASEPVHTCSRGHRDTYGEQDYMDWS